MNRPAPVAGSSLSVEDLAADPRPLLVLGTAPWCHHCRALKPKLFEALARASVAAGAAGADAAVVPTLVEVDVDRLPDLARDLRIHALPTLMVRREGRELARQVGATDGNGLDALIRVATTGVRPPRHGWPGPSQLDRTLRLVAGAGLAAVGLASNRSPWLLGLAALLLASALYDRCPLLRALVSRRPAP